MGVNNQFKSDGSTAIEALAIKLVIYKNRHLILVNLYSRGCDHETLNGLFKELRTIKGTYDVIFTGDLNAHHPAWGSINSDAEGRAVIEWLEEQDVAVLRKPRKSNLAQNVICFYKNGVFTGHFLRKYWISYPIGRHRYEHGGILSWSIYIQEDVILKL
ncbi:hypothetical protein DPMN_094747 [Dreissena polymorpha]|uniref:Endonuclease/exonuclease/phosphatase domain-containing protein n=1 Tax=Dreissena polymorpha TaxID=45954 RepID=A0A9D4L597_DREPO|nr:hypothetical protein DPMN_094747 [Dreissena polymorpha]